MLLGQNETHGVFYVMMYVDVQEDPYNKDEFLVPRPHQPKVSANEGRERRIANKVPFFAIITFVSQTYMQKDF